MQNINRRDQAHRFFLRVDQDNPLGLVLDKNPPQSGNGSIRAGSNRFSLHKFTHRGITKLAAQSSLQLPPGNHPGDLSLFQDRATAVPFILKKFIGRGHGMDSIDRRDRGGGNL